MKQIEDSMPPFLSETHRVKQQLRIKAVQRMQEHPLSAEQIIEQCKRNHRDSVNARKKEAEEK